MEEDLVVRKQHARAVHRGSHRREICRQLSGQACRGQGGKEEEVNVPGPTRQCQRGMGRDGP